MGKKLLYQIITFILLLITIKATAIAYETVDFGSTTAKQIIVVARNLKVAVPESDCGLFIEANFGLMDNNNHNKIPKERMTLLWGNKMIPLNQSQIFIDSKDLSQIAVINLKLNLELRPIDQPGLYVGEILLKLWKPNLENPSRKEWLSLPSISIPIKVSVEAWINLQTDSLFVKLESLSFSGHRNLENTESLTLKVASNTNWIVYLELFETDATIFPIMVKTSGSTRNYRGIDQISISPFQGRKMVATGIATVNETQYWCQIPVRVSINDFTKYPAGIYKLKLHFTGEIYDEKSTVNF